MIHITLNKIFHQAGGGVRHKEFLLYCHDTEIPECAANSITVLTCIYIICYSVTLEKLFRLKFDSSVSNDGNSHRPRDCLSRNIAEGSNSFSPHLYSTTKETF